MQEINKYIARYLAGPITSINGHYLEGTRVCSRPLPRLCHLVRLVITLYSESGILSKHDPVALGEFVPGSIIESTFVRVIH